MRSQTPCGRYRVMWSQREFRSNCAAGGELRLSPYIAEDLPKMGVPTYGHAGKYVLADLWEPEWPLWATRAVEWLQAHGVCGDYRASERMPMMQGSIED